VLIKKTKLSFSTSVAKLLASGSNYGETPRFEQIPKTVMDCSRLAKKIIAMLSACAGAFASAANPKPSTCPKYDVI
jgi:hypothetical protein